MAAAPGHSLAVAVEALEISALAANEPAIVPAASLYAAYGLSDAFDARLELSTALQNRLEVAASFFSFKGVLACKLDVGQWVPWIGPSLGGLAMGLQSWPFDGIQPTVGLIAGLDHAWTRHFGMGLCVSGDYGFEQKIVYGAGYLRAEYHFGS